MNTFSSYNDIDFDCLRDTLILTQQLLPKDEPRQQHNTVHWSVIYNHPDLLEKYDTDSIKYCLKQMYQEDFFIISKHSIGSNKEILSLNIKDLSMKGHIFLDNIQNEDTWKLVKAEADSKGLNVISVLEEYIRNVAAKIA